ncbi:clathrin light chain B [Megalobrama amblycephala]|uniref:clathrin light chain B n=1 Tax=Megalobrama amblycephala TaxID=75352 RepID=UPI0020145FF7|nr:clathrin light chain B [Megalobrama amblycephala]
MADDFGFSASDNGVHVEEDPAAAFLAQQENEIAVIENDSAGFGALEDGGPPPADTYTFIGGDFGGAPATAVNGDMFQNQKARLEELDSASKAAETVWREKARKELEDWHVHQNEQMEKNKANNRIADKAFYKQPNSDAIGFVVSEEAFLKECDDDSPGTEWEKVARLCDFNPKTSRQTKDVSRMRSVLISLKQTPLVR